MFLIPSQEEEADVEADLAAAVEVAMFLLMKEAPLSLKR